MYPTFWWDFAGSVVDLDLVIEKYQREHPKHQPAEPKRKVSPQTPREPEECDQHGDVGAQALVTLQYTLSSINSGLKDTANLLRQAAKLLIDGGQQ